MADFDNGSSGSMGSFDLNQATPGLAQSISMGNAMSAQGDLRGTLQSFRDSLAFSFQTLNLTLSSLNNTMNTVGTKLTSVQFGPTGSLPEVRAGVIPYSEGTYYGGMSPAYAQYMGDKGFFGTMMAPRPFNINPAEFYTNRGRETALRAGNFGASFVPQLTADIGGQVIGDYFARAAVSKLGLSGFLGTAARFGLGIPFAMPFTAAIEAIGKPMAQFAVEHNRDVGQLQNMSARFAPTQFSLRESQRAMAGIENLAYRESQTATVMDNRLNMSGFRDIMNMGLQGGLFHGTSPEQLVSQVEQASHVVKFLTGVMGSKDVQETMQMVKQLKDMGVNLFKDPSFARDLGRNAFRYGQLSGIGADQLLNQATGMSASAYGQYGLPAFMGINTNMRNISYIHELEKRGVLTPAELAVGGGVQGIATRMAGFDAAMLRSPVGQVTMLSGWNGANGFDKNLFAQNAKGGFFGSLAGAARQFFANGTESMAMAMMNQAEIAAQMDKQGGVQDYLLQQLSSTVTHLPQWHTASQEGKVALAAWHLQVLARQAGQEIDATTAKALATRFVRPTFMKGLEYNARQAETIGSVNEIREMHSFGAGVNRFKDELWRRPIASLHHTFIEEPGRWLADTFTNKAADVLNHFDWDRVSRADPELSGNVFDRFQRSQRILSGSNEKAILDRYVMGSDNENLSAWQQRERLREVSQAYNGATDPTGKTSWGNSIPGGNATARARAMQVAFSYNMARDNQWIWRERAAGDIMSKTGAISMLSPYLEGASVQDLERIASGYKRNNTADSYVRSGADMLYTYGNKALRERARANYADYEDALLTDEHIGEFDITAALGGVYQGKGKHTSDEIYALLGQDSAQKALAAYSDKYRRITGTNMTNDVLRGIIATRNGASVRPENDKNANMISLTAQAGLTYEAGRAGNAYGTGENVETWLHAGDGKALDMSKETVSGALKDLGIDSKDLEGLTREDFAAIERMGNALQESNGNASYFPEWMLKLGFSAGRKELTSDQIEQIKGKKVSKAGEKILDRLNTTEGRRVLEGLEEKMKEKGVTDFKWGQGASTVFAYEDSENAKASFAKGMALLGDRIDNKKAGELLGMGGEDFYKYIINKTGQGNNEMDALGQKMLGLTKLSNEALSQKAGMEVGTDAQRYDAIRKIGLGSVMTHEAQVEQKKDAALNKINSAVDAAVDVVGGQAVMRVKIIDSDIKELRGQVTANTDSEKATDASKNAQKDTNFSTNPANAKTNSSTVKKDAAGITRTGGH